MDLDQRTDKEVALELARRLRAWRIDPRGAGLSQRELSRRTGVGDTPIKRFEKTGGLGLNNFIALLRGLGLLDRLEDLVPDPSTPSPMELLEASRRAPAARKRAPRTPGKSTRKAPGRKTARAARRG